MTTHEATRSDPGAVIQAAPNRKRVLGHRLNPQFFPTTELLVKRPRRVTKETWKAREAREVREALEEVEAKRSQTSLDRY